MKHIRLFMILIFVIMISWFLSITLTQQRIQSEAVNKALNISIHETPFVWSFEDINKDIVKSFHRFWSFDNQDKTVTANKSNKASMSLSLSSESINSQIHSDLIIHTKQSINGFLNIQFKSNLDDGIFYYSEKIHLVDSINIVNLDKLVWHATNESGEKVGYEKWGTSLNKVSSVVLYFSKHKVDVVIDKIELPYSNTRMESNAYNIDCAGDVVGESILLGRSTFVLQELCYLPSTYMWLKKNLNNRFPESTFSINDVKPWQNATKHSVNQQYTNIIPINVLLYILIGCLLSLIYKLSLYENKVKSIQINHSLVKSYSLILLPTLVIVALMLLSFDFNKDFMYQIPVYVLWAIVQQLLLGYILAEKIFFIRTNDKFHASFYAALVFSVFHLPSITLFLVTLLAGVFWSYAWLTYRRVVPLAISHALLANVFYSIVSEKYLYSAKVLQWFWL